MITTVPALRLDHLEHPGVRDRMLAEWTKEIEDLERRLPRGNWPFGSDLNAAGWTAYLESMPVALVRHDMAWLAVVMNDPRLWRPARIQMRRGRATQVNINIPDAAVKLAHCEYDMAYTRAVAGLALDNGIATCEVYRAGYALTPRQSCSCLEGAIVSCVAVIEGHRAYFTGVFAEISIPAGPHCHHTVRIREWAAVDASTSSAIHSTVEEI